MAPRPTVPLFDFGDTFPTTVQIGDTGIALPLNIKRMGKVDLDAFEQSWAELVEPRGVDAAALSPEDAAARDAAQLAFYEASIREYITVDEGFLVNRGASVTDGEGLLDMFYARKDILSSFLVAVFVENRLGGALRKNSNSPRDSDRGSEQSIPTRGGDTQGSTAANAALSNTAATVDATGASSLAALPPLARVSSGEASVATVAG